MTGTESLADRLSELKAVAPAGFAIALHVDFTTPLYLFQTYPEAWRTLYSAEGLHIQDPTVHWGIANSGLVRWSELAAQDGAGVLARAAEHGLLHGVTVAIQDGDRPSLASYSRSDRDFTEDEAASLLSETQALHELTRDSGILGEEIARELRHMSILFTHA